MLLNLDFSPRAEDIAATRDLWVFAFMRSIGRIDEDIDAHRIDKAFAKAIHTLKKWPSPATVIELMPRRPEAKQIGYEPPADRTTAKNAFDVCFAVIAGDITMEQANALLAGTDEPDTDIPF